MKRPPFTLNSSILKLIAEIQSFLGEVKSLSLQKPSIKLRRENKIKTIHHSLAIEGNTLSEEEISSVLDGKRILGPKKQIVEVKNALQVYQRMNEFEPESKTDLLYAHRLLMDGLIEKPGKYRTGAVGIFKGEKVSRIVPSNKLVPKLMGNLFQFLKLDKETHALLKACIFHYELEFIHPFADGNGRMGRLWQQLLLIRVSPIFEFLPIESMIHRDQRKYYSALEQSDTKGESTEFIEFSLKMILGALNEYSGRLLNQKPKAQDRIDFALEHFSDVSFTRSDYLALFKGMSTATASRDLALGVREKKLRMKGTKALAVYSTV